MAAIGGTVRVLQVPLSPSSLNDGDVFILDNGTTIYQFNAPNSSPSERARAMEIVHTDLRASRNDDAEVVPLDGEEVFECEAFWELLGGDKPDVLAEPHGDRDAADTDDADLSAPKKLLKISNATGELVMSLEAEGDTLSAGDTNDEDVWAVGCDGRCFVRIGSAASAEEKYWVWNKCGAIVAALDLEEDAPVMFFSHQNEVEIWSQLFE